MAHPNDMTAQQVQAFYLRVTGETTVPAGATSMDLFTWAREALQAKEEAARKVGRQMRAAAEAVRVAAAR